MAKMSKAPTDAELMARYERAEADRARALCGPKRRRTPTTRKAGK